MSLPESSWRTSGVVTAVRARILPVSLRCSVRQITLFVRGKPKNTEFRAAVSKGLDTCQPILGMPFINSAMPVVELLGKLRGPSNSFQRRPKSSMSAATNTGASPVAMTIAIEGSGRGRRNLTKAKASNASSGERFQLVIGDVGTQKRNAACIGAKSCGTLILLIRRSPGSDQAEAQRT
jgi:hypothetical protein